MRNNESVAVGTSKVLLVPYRPHHVPKYHEWMKDPAIQEATASEPLTLEQEYNMQESWREHHDKLTFIVCLPLAESNDARKGVEAGVLDADKDMIGDVNMFLTTVDDEEDGETGVIGELELMIATKGHQNQGRGRGALLAFLRYIAEHEHAIVDEVLSTSPHTCKSRQLSYICAKIGEQNHRSIGLFESVGFVKTSIESSYFGEFELRRKSLSLEAVESLFEQYNIGNYSEMIYEDGQGTYYEVEPDLSYIRIQPLPSNLTQ